MLNEFYSKALPDEGIYCIAYNKPNTKLFNQAFAQTLDEAVNLIDKYKEHHNTFIAMGTFETQKREAARTKFIKSFYLDLDVGENKEYASQKEALLALGDFIEKTQLPMPAIVNSGNGIHVYWFLKHQITGEEWKPLAERLKKFCMSMGLKIDPSVTADSARILRCPDTNNYKSEPPRPTLILKDAPVYELKRIMSCIESKEVSLEELVTHQSFTEEEKKLKYGNIENKFEVLLKNSVKENDQGCAQVKYYIDNVKSTPEPVWWRVISLIQNSVDRDKWVHILSKDHPGYSYEETEEKSLSTQGKPHTCADIDNNNPGICTKCPHWKKISTPLQLCKVPIKAEVVEAAAIEGEVITIPKKEKNRLPQTLDDKGYWIGKNHGGVYRTVTVHDKKGGASFEDQILIYDYEMLVVKHLKSSIDKNCLLVNVYHPHDGLLEFILPMKTVYDPTELRKILTSQGIYYQSKQQEDYIMKYFIDYATDMQRKGKLDTMYDQMGWNQDKSSFVLGRKELRRDGTEKDTPISNLAQTIAPFLTQSGTYANWRAAAQKLNQHGLEMHMFTMLCGFGSILMEFSSTAGVAISLTGESGSAKTGALKAATSIWGEPENVYATTTTPLALQQRFLTLHSLPVGWDEVGNRSAYHISDFVLGVSSGKAKLRMQASTNQERNVEAPASVIAILTSNHSLIDKLKQLRANPNGEAARLIEFTVRKPKAFMDDARIGKEIFDVFNSDYGWAGPDFVKAVYAFGDTPKIKANLAKWEQRFVEDFGNDTAYRFYENLVAVTMTAGEIVNEANILTIDVERIYKFIIGEMITIRDEVVKINDQDYEDILDTYMNTNLDKQLVFRDGKMESAPDRQLTIRIDHDKNFIYLSKRDFDQHLAELTISTKEYVYQMKQLGVDIEAGSGVKQRMTAGWQDVSKAATSVYKIAISTLGAKVEIKNAATQ